MNRRAKRPTTAGTCGVPEGMPDLELPSLTSVSPGAEDCSMGK